MVLNIAMLPVYIACLYKPSFVCTSLLPIVAYMTYVALLHYINRSLCVTDVEQLLDRLYVGSLNDGICIILLAVLFSFKSDK